MSLHFKPSTVFTISSCTASLYSHCQGKNVVERTSEIFVALPKHLSLYGICPLLISNRNKLEVQKLVFFKLGLLKHQFSFPSFFKQELSWNDYLINLVDFLTGKYFDNRSVGFSLVVPAPQLCKFAGCTYTHTQEHTSLSASILVKHLAELAEPAGGIRPSRSPGAFSVTGHEEATEPVPGSPAVTMHIHTQHCGTHAHMAIPTCVCMCVWSEAGDN